MPRILPTTVMTKAIAQRDGTFDGLFYVGIKTTGVFCRPSCPARPARPENREFYSTVPQALSAGYRPCKRCRPLDTNGKPPAWVTRLLEAVEADPQARWRDRDVRGLGIDPSRARRYFHDHHGMSFLAYARGRRMGHALKELKKGSTLDRVIVTNGFDSHSGFRDAFSKLFGQPPGRGRNAECITAMWLESPLGPLVAGATEKAICFLEFSDRRALESQIETMQHRFNQPIVPGTSPLLQQLKQELEEYFAGKRKRFTVPLEYPGTSFQQKVWAELLKIPYGKTCSYEDIAKAVGSAKAVRAVGTANGCNRIAIVIPCHRVVNKGGKLGGYGGGLWRKQFLLDLERGVG